ncbi:Holliday junction resolvase RuvX [Candidatus Acetothermia bacterium]|jgi:putative Holliday junction resolvase|nr:Holliday junction resolvase RuvX [Candidatus Acetothermia bacterium]MCI2427377.1 Holliday junction resolvase RuvX [Candidatus Acetothermia bacterium]MCI2428714.1 Holliday junction resolvase RuvX [Candidatus Acetothermia bacterium]
MKICGLDYGRKRIGIAVSDEMEIIAYPLPSYQRVSAVKDLAFFASLVAKEEIRAIVVGFPLNMDNSIGEMAQEVLNFCALLRSELLLPVYTYDERWTSIEAARVLTQANITQQQRKDLRDSLSAVIILQGYLNLSKQAH